LRELQPVLVHVGDHDVSGGGMPGNCDCHDADRPRACNEHVLSYEVEGEGGVCRVTERVQYRGHLVCDGVRQLEYVECRNGNVFCECSGAAYADAHRVPAEVPPPGAAVPADAAGDMSFCRDPISCCKRALVAAALDDLAGKLVADRRRHGNRLLRPVVPVVDMDVRAAYGGTTHLDENVVVPGHR